MIIRLLFLSICCRLAHGQGFNIAGLFEEGSNELNVKAFELAIERANQNKDEDHALITLTVNIPPENPFVAMNSTCSLTKQGIIGVFGPSSLSNIHAVQAVCDAKEIPHVLSKWMSEPTKLGSSLNFYPHPPLLTKAYIDFIQEWKWTTFTILYEDDESLLRLSGLILYAKETGVVITVEQLDREGTGNYRDTLKKIRRTRQKFIIIDCRIDNLIDILIQCQQIGLMTHEYNYFITNLDAHTRDLSPFQWSQSNITGIRMINPDSAYVQEISKEIFADQVDEDPSQTASRLETETALIFDAVYMFTDIISKMADIETFGVPLDCYQSDSWVHGYSIVNFLKTSTYKGLTGPIEFNNEGFRSTFNLQIYELREGGITTVALWNSSEGLNITKKFDEPLELGKDSMRNKTFTVIISLTDPYGMNKEASEQLVGNDRYEGFSIDLIEELAKLEGFNYTFVVQADGKNGNKVNGQWTGMIGEVMAGRADMAITDLTITSDRAEAVDFTSPFMNLGVSILFQKPTKAPPNFFSFAEPFALDTWIALAVAFVIVSLSFFLLGRICPDEWTNPYPCVEEPEFLINQFSLANSVWFATGAMLQQGSEIAPIAIPTRLVSGVWWFFVLIMVSSYTANLASFLVTENHVELFTDVKSLLENADKYGIRYGAKANGATMDFFEKSTGNELYQEIAKYMREHPEDMPNDNKVGVTMAEEMRYAFFMESTTIEYTIQRHCGLTIVGDRLDEKGYGIALKKDSPYRTRLSLAILKLQTSGEIEKIRKKWWEERKGGGQCTGAADDPSATPLDLQNVEGIFYVTIFGTVLGMVLVLFEFIFNIFRVAKKAKVSIFQALKNEIKFFLKFNSNVKPVLDARSEEDEDEPEDKSEAQSESLRSRSKSERSKGTTTNGTTRPYGFVISSPSLDRLTESP
ncbi:glutamate receptor ionotropic, kainate 3-like [Rhynchophorus ferrugineus]|uniref:glutamate receptor ionotropic, kainate 3-like n=1 Tax=Rhynchophorus ferrugineus TaxID=354439 RepID=UPI003FCD7C3F